MAVWVTNNVLVCEDEDQAQYVAYESDARHYKDVSKSVLFITFGTYLPLNSFYFHFTQ